MKYLHITIVEHCFPYGNVMCLDNFLNRSPVSLCGRTADTAHLLNNSRVENS